MMCYYCEIHLPLQKLTLDHIYPMERHKIKKQVQKKFWKMGNLILSCEPCNKRKGGRIITIEEFKKEVMGDRYRPFPIMHTLSKKKDKPKPLPDSDAPQKRRKSDIHIFAKDVVYPKKAVIIRSKVSFWKKFIKWLRY